MTAALSHQAQAFAVDLARLLIWLVVLTLVFVPLERLFVLHPRKQRWKAVPADLAFYFLNSLLPALLLAIPLAAMAAAARQFTPAPYAHAVAALPLWAKIAAGIVVGEIGAYWAHRWSHETPLLWRFHAVHHAPEHVDWLVNTRAHPIDMVFTRLCSLAPLYALGLAQPTGGQVAMVPVYITLIGTVWAFFIHANVRWRFGPLEQLVATPAFHHWHHTNDEHRDHNYAALLPVVDRLFGTFHLPRHWPPAYGVDDPPPAGFTDQLLHPFAPRRRARVVSQAVTETCETRVNETEANPSRVWRTK